MIYFLIGFVILGTAVLNRLRGTGLIKHFGTIKIFKQDVKINLVWNHVFGLWYACLFGFFSTWYIGIVIFIAYIIGESKGWGEWIGALTTSEIKDEQWLKRQYIDNEGKKFPFIHQIANFFVPEQIGTYRTIEDKIKQYTKYASLALMIRGIYWFLGIYLILYIANVINVFELFGILLFLGVSFPVACYLGKRLKFTKSIGFLHFSRGWENQEFIYGLFQGVAISLALIDNF